MGWRLGSARAVLGGLIREGRPGEVTSEQVAERGGRASRGHARVALSQAEAVAQGEACRGRTL